MQHVNKKHISRAFRMLCVAIALVCAIALACAGIAYATTETNTSDNKKLHNGSFEDKQTWTKDYYQPKAGDVPYWNTTAFEGKLELFRKNTGTYIKNVTLTPSEGTYAAELNADEESTLYQSVTTTPSSVYEWGLDHGARSGTDTMALIIGPNQTVAPSKPNKNGRDQLMQMVDWLIVQGKTSVKTQAGLGERFTVYSKKFAESGSFEDNTDNDAFSMTPSSVYTEEWRIWIIADSNVTSGTNPWGSYGSNVKDPTSGGGSSGTGELNLNKYNLYTVPAGQTETLFCFVSIGCIPDKGKTFGNFIDNINFQIYHPLSGSSTHHGSAIVGGSDGTVGGVGASSGHTITVDKSLATYISDGETLKIQAIVTKNDADDGCQFVGVYRTKQNDSGEAVLEFINVREGERGNVIDDTGSLTDDQKSGKWVKSTNTNGDTIYTYYLGNIISATDLHFVFIKNPTVTYDPNGGKPYIIDNRPHKESEAENVYSFKPKTDPEGTIVDSSFIEPYTSKAAEGKNDGWKFMGWKLMGDIVDGAGQLESLPLPAEHTIACDYSVNGAAGEKSAQYFKIYRGKTSELSKEIKRSSETGSILGVTWNDSGANKLYANFHRGLTMVAQWRWRQAFIPQVAQGSGYIDSSEGGTVEIISVTNTEDKNYNGSYGKNGGKSYHAETNEKVIAKATAKEGYRFIGWYDESGNLLTTNDEYGYVESKESVKTFYARFTGVKQTYIRQIKRGDRWEDLDNAKPGNDSIGTLDRYSITDAVGSSISSTATVGTGYKFVGWYDSEGNKVSNDMLKNDGTTLSYTITGDATYYARFEDAYSLVVSKVDNNDAPVAGAEFTLYQQDNSGTVTITYGGKPIKCTVIGSAVTTLNSNKTKATANFTDKLSIGKEYYLAETKAPAGYRLDDKIYKITIDSDVSARIDGLYKEVTNKTVNVGVTNCLTIHMPVAGSKITGGCFAVAGLILLATAAIGLLAINMSRRKRYY